MPAANPIRGEVAFRASGASWTLSFSANALVTLEAELDLGVQEIGVRLGSPSVRIAELRTAFWAGLLDHHPETTIEEAGLLMTALGVPEAGAKMGMAFLGAFPPPKEEGDDSRPRKAGGTGSRSTATGAKSGSTRKASGGSPPA
jgi:hypothetical protein